MADRKVKKAEPKQEKRTDLKAYKLKRDYPTSKGVLKAGDTIKLNEQGRTVLTKQKFI